jgi:hypothetical protein
VVMRLGSPAYGRLRPAHRSSPGEGVVVGQTALLGDFLRRFQQRIPEHHREQERRVTRISL